MTEWTKSGRIKLNSVKYVYLNINKSINDKQYDVLKVSDSVLKEVRGSYFGIILDS